MEVLGRRWGRADRDIRERIGVSLQDTRLAWVKNLSGGQRQRLACGSGASPSASSRATPTSAASPPRDPTACWERFPAAVHPFLRLLPLTALNDALRAVILEGAPLGASPGRLVLLLAWGGVAFAVGLAAFRWK